jgi:uncharacterized protein
VISAAEVGQDNFMRVAITGSSGLVGRALRGSLAADGHEVIRLVRRPPEAPDEVEWDPERGQLDPERLDGADAVVNLAGPPIAGRRWPESYKKIILASRANATHTVAETLVKLEHPPRVFISASGVQLYGIEHGPEVLDEEEAPGAGFLAGVCEQWEAAATPAADAGIAVCHPRFGFVMSRHGGLLARMLPRFRAGLGGPLGTGEQYWSHISLVDAVRALRFLMATPGCIGPYNFTAPEPVKNAEFARVLAYTLRRPTLLPVPAVALQARYGEMATYPLTSLRVLPGRLMAAGFAFEHPTARRVIAAALR